MASSRRGFFWLLITASILCCFAYPIPFGIFCLRVKQRWLWYVCAASVVTVAILFIALALSPSVPDPGSTTGATHKETTAFGIAATAVFTLGWLATMVIMFIKRKAYEESYVREGKSLSLMTPAAATQYAPPAQFAAPPAQLAELSPAPAVLDINTATVADLVALGLSADAAAAIVAQRAALGTFTSAVQVQSVPGLAPHQWALLRQHLRFGSDDSPDPGSPRSGRILDL